MTNGFSRLATLALASAALWTSALDASHAGQMGGLTRPLKETRSNLFLIEKRPTLAPFAQIRFCVQNPADCRSSGGAANETLDGAKRRELARVNADVNRAIRPTSDAADQDEWQAGVSSGDCEDYALTKRRRLIEQGWSPRALRIAVAKTAAGEGHAVLVVRTSEGDLVLDNRHDAIRPVQRSGLRWLKIQSGDNPILWFDV